MELCHTCRRILGTAAQGEVLYGKIWLCLQCHIMERELELVKGRGSVERIFRQCGGQCGGASAVAGDCTPVWFCYDCCQYLCGMCVKSEHDRHVSSWQKKKKTVLITKNSMFLKKRNNITKIIKLQNEDDENSCLDI